MAITAIWGPPVSGKTTLAMDLSHAIAKSGKSVCLVSPEPYSEMSGLLNVMLMKPNSIEAAYHTGGSLWQTVYQLDGLLFLLAASYFSDAFEQEPFTGDVKNLLKELESTFEFVIVDCPSCSGNTMAAWAINMAKTVILLTGFRSASGMWNKSFQRAIQAVDHKMLPVCVQGSDNFDYRSLNRLIGITPRVLVPYISDAEAVQQIRKVLYDAGGKTGRAYNAAIDEICAVLKEAENEHQFV